MKQSYVHYKSILYVIHPNETEQHAVSATEEEASKEKRGNEPSSEEDAHTAYVCMYVEERSPV